MERLILRGNLLGMVDHEDIDHSLAVFQPQPQLILQSLHERAIVGIQGAAGYTEGMPLPTSW